MSENEKYIKLLVWTDGDMSVGLSGEQAELNLPVDGFFDDTDRLEFIHNAKEIFARAFSELWECGAHIATEDEIAMQIKSDCFDCDVCDTTSRQKMKV